MLVEFAVANFRSVKEEVRLSLVASPDRRLEGLNVAAKELAPGVRPTSDVLVTLVEVALTLYSAEQLFYQN